MELKNVSTLFEKMGHKTEKEVSPILCSFQSLHITPNSQTSSAITKYSSITSILKGKTGRSMREKAHYQTASVVLRELVDRDLGFIIILILKKKKKEKRDKRRKVF